MQRFPALTRLVLATTEFFPFTYRSVHAAARYTANIFHGSKYFLLARYAADVCSLLAAVSRLDSVRELEVTQPAVTPDLLLLR